MFDAEISFDPSADLAGLLAGVPAKWVVYLMSDEAGAPVQLLCVKNLRASLQRRLGENEQIGPSRRVGYRELVRKISWRRVDSAFEADCVYLEMARQIFPQTYRGMLAFKEAWFLHVDPTAQFPRYTKTNDPSLVRISPSPGTPGEGRGGGSFGMQNDESRVQNGPHPNPLPAYRERGQNSKSGGEVIGPIKDKDSAGRVIELVEDAFDLCRYYNVLTEAPNGKACAYKEMGRCDAPCDGSVSLATYRELIGRSAAALLDGESYRARQEEKMRQLAAELNFEAAAKIKTHLERVARLHAGAYSHLRSVADFRFIAMERGPGEKKAKIFLITPTRLEECMDICSRPSNWRVVMEHLWQRMEEPDGEIDRAAAEHMAIVASHLFMPKKQGVLLPWKETDERSLAAAYRQLGKQKVDAEPAGEGMIRDLQSF